MNMTPEHFFSALAHPLRLRALTLLADCGELCVCELTHALGAAQPTMSRHLAQLREAGVVTDRRAGQWIYYRLHSGLPPWARAVIDTTAEALAPGEPYASDRASLAAMPNRPGAACCA